MRLRLLRPRGMRGESSGHKDSKGKDSRGKTGEGRKREDRKRVGTARNPSALLSRHPSHAPLKACPATGIRTNPIPP
ncbi:hypothetical protein GCM10007301_00770 [Azorhizobium oxalatiphilum]|uniref:Uncharacterized protein n=1 Tax=Azorhizobium oxalatiphilum TaxID=980631 RepID=A0A917BIA0_9HYPH|nr:hypothetical protein GCM10007301_00770 [Azorhizobium oxalatiphilum]